MKTLVQAGFETIDAVLPVPDRTNAAYFFSGTWYARIRYIPGTAEEKVISNPARIVDGWKTLAKANFDTIDAVIPVPGLKNEAYFFSGSPYVRIRFTPDSPEEQIVSDPTRIAGAWKCLAWGW